MWLEFSAVNIFGKGSDFICLRERTWKLNFGAYERPVTCMQSAEVQNTPVIILCPSLVLVAGVILNLANLN